MATLNEKERAESKLAWSSVKKILDKGATKRLVMYSSLRILANGLDILGLVGIAILATAFGSFASGAGQLAEVNLPFIGDLRITETEAVALGFVVMIVFVTKSGFSILLNLKTALFVARLETQLSVRLAGHFFSANELGRTNKPSLSDFQSVAIQSTGGIKSYLNARIQLFAEGSLLLFLLAVFLIINPISTVVLVAFMACGLVALNRLINVRLAQSGNNYMDGSRAVIQTARDLHGVQREARATGVMDHWLEKFAEGREKMASSSAKMFALSSYPRFVIETFLILGIFLFIGGVIVFSDIPSQATTVGVFLAGGLRMMASIIPFQSAFTSMRAGAATGRFAVEILEDLPSGVAEAVTRRPKKQSMKSGLRFEDVSLSYDSGSEPVIKRVSFEIHPRTKVALVGPSGSGKSTILDLATGYLLPDAGEVMFGTKTAREVLLQHPRTFALVPQRPHLIDGSIVENIALVHHQFAKKKTVKEVLIKAGLGHLTLSKNWASMVIKPDSGQLSGGEIQRLSIARALYSDPSFLFLDEATSALDAQTEHQISEVLEILKDQMTILTIAHRLSTVKQADKIIYLDNGTIVAEGTFEELKLKVPDFAASIALMGLEDADS